MNLNKMNSKNILKILINQEKKLIEELINSKPKEGQNHNY